MSKIKVRRFVMKVRLSDAEVPASFIKVRLFIAKVPMSATEVRLFAIKVPLSVVKVRPFITEVRRFGIKWKYVVDAKFLLSAKRGEGQDEGFVIFSVKSKLPTPPLLTRSLPARSALTSLQRCWIPFAVSQTEKVSFGEEREENFTSFAVLISKGIIPESKRADKARLQLA